jgi:chromatin remodeling complex protein RSC6
MASSKKSSASKTKKAAATKPVAEPVTPAPEKTEVVEPTTDVKTEEAPVAEEYTSIVSALEEVQKTIRGLVQKVKLLKKENDKLRKQKTRGKRAQDANKPPRAPSGFAKPSKVSDQLATFLGIAKDALISRTEATSIINEYIKKNSLRDEADKRKIIPDKKLSAILSAKKGEEVTYFNMQKYLKHHFTSVTAAA